MKRYWPLLGPADVLLVLQRIIQGKRFWRNVMCVPLYEVMKPVCIPVLLKTISFHFREHIPSLSGLTGYRQ